MTIFDEVLSFINAPKAAHFETLALAVFAYQVQHVPAYHTYLASIEVNPATVRSIDEIPPISTLAYKYTRIENELHPEAPGSRLFMTSGTTIGREERGRHLVPLPEIYRASAIGHLRRMMFPDRKRLAMLALHPTADQITESSLAQMISWCIEECGDGFTLYAATRESVDTDAAVDFLCAAEALHRPSCILGTTASCAALFATLRQRGICISLPAGSRLMDTGGAKGQRVALSPEQVVSEAHALLGIEPPLVINEYGMTEMCSQLYDATSFNSGLVGKPGLRTKLAPPWVKPFALDPLTLRSTSNGRPGILAFFDLANVGSVSALMTEDIGIVRDNAVIVLGRAAAADRRGCALAIDQFAESEESPLSSQKIALTQLTASSGKAQAPLVPNSHKDEDHPAPAVADIHAAASRLHRAVAAASSTTDLSAVGALFSEVMGQIEKSERWRQAIREIAAGLGYSDALLTLSLRALVRPLRNVAELVWKVRPRHEVLGFIMPGNLPGAGLHELVIALLAGCGALVKTSKSEPVFFSELAMTLHELDRKFGSNLGARIEVFNWSRERTDLADALLQSCDRVVALGKDATVAELERHAGRNRLLAFGNRFSGAAVMRERTRGESWVETARALALDCAMFDQRGCLSPHHIFVEEHAREFAALIAASFAEFAPLLGNIGSPRRLELDDSAAIRRVREAARWRRLNGAKVELWEDVNFQWTVVFDETACFTPSPGFCTVCVSPFDDPADLERRLEPARGRLEGFAISGDESADAVSDKTPAIRRIREIVERCGATHICAAGEIQSPPLDWPHGGGEFIRMFLR
jgi:hypothetical protein